jgi:ABC-type lipoprotein export system ATPase subunit
MHSISLPAKVSWIQLEQVSKSYPDHQQRVFALKGVDLSLKAGEICTIEGPSGAGKSTLLAIIGCLDYPDSGKVLFDRVDICRLNHQKTGALRNQLIGHVYENNNLLSALSLVENLALILRLTGGLRLSQARQESQGALESLGLRHVSQRRPARISAGELKRAGIGRALIKKPWLLLLDEPTANLDAENAAWIINVLLGYHRQRGGITVAVSHDPALLEQSDRRLQLDKGRITSIG